MSTKPQKDQKFVAELMRNKSVTELAGVDEDAGRQLEAAGFDKAHNVLGQYLLLKKDKELFQNWLEDTCSVSTKQSRDCYQCLTDWCAKFL